MVKLIPREMPMMMAPVLPRTVSGGEEESISASPRVALRNGLYIYRATGSELAHGSSLGNAKAWATSKGTGAIESLFSIDIGRAVLGSLVVGYFVRYNDLSHFGCPRSPMLRGQECDRLVMLSTVGEIIFQLHPAYQQRIYSMIGQVDVCETFFLPRTGLDDEAVAFYTGTLTNRGVRSIAVTVIGCQDLVGTTPLDVKAEYHSSINGLTAWNASSPQWARAFSSLPRPDRYMATSDIEESYDPGEPLSNQTDEEGRIVGSLQLDLVIPPGGNRDFAFMMAFSPNGCEGLEEVFHRYKDCHKAFDSTVAHYETSLGTSGVVTPDPVVNQGGQWSKANMLRVLSKYPFGGTGFTNDPGNSSNIVIRDTCWYVYGSDYFLPLDTCGLLHNMADLQEESGKIVEYYNALNGSTSDYGLNINDNTPLFILAVAHHLNATGHKRCLDRLYSPIIKAAEYMISQEDERGLVFCAATGTGVYGIAGWRNIIPDRNISGAVTEINSECYAALRAVAGIAESIGNKDEWARFTYEAEKLRDAINTHLLNPKNGTYYLNIGPHDDVHTDVTADEVFPLLFGVGDEDTGRLISTRLSSPDFMTPAGLRTVPSQNPLYKPDKNVGLEGGVWPGVTWWYAIASATTDPSLMIHALKSSYQHYVNDPGIHNTVPGQFSEWFDGQSLVNRGMRLSPWEPPRFLWTLLEGAVGLDVSLTGLKVNPRIPPEWHWLILNNLPYHDQAVSFFMARQVDGIRFYTTDRFETSHTMERQDRNVSDRVRTLSADMYTMAFTRGEEVTICLASTASEKQTAAFSTNDLFDPRAEYWVTVYSSETGDWAKIGPYAGDYLDKLSAWIEPGGFTILIVRKV